MRFSFPSCFAVATVVVCSGVVSCVEGTFTSARVRMGFVNHGAMWSDLLVWPILVGLTFPLVTRNAVWWSVCLGLSVIVTLAAHRMWYADILNDGMTGHLFAVGQPGPWRTVVTYSGWMHVGLMAGCLLMVLLYLLSPMPQSTVMVVSGLLTIHLVLAMVQPAWYCGYAVLSWRTLRIPAVLFGAVCVSCWLKCGGIGSGWLN